MQIETFKVFCDLVETQSFTRAAKNNNVTQSAVSQQVSSMERHFRTPLIERTSKKFALTREGQALYEFSKNIVQNYDSLLHRIQEIKNIVSGSIKVSTIYSIGLHELPPYLKDFLRSHPTVNVAVEYRRASQVYEDIIGNSADLGLVAYPHTDLRLTIVALRRDLLTLVCHPDHPLASRKSITLPDLQGQKFISFQPDIPTRREIDKLFKSRDVTVQTIMEFDNIETVKRAIEINAGVGILPKGTIAQEIARKSLVCIPIADGNFYRPLAAIHRKNKVLSPAMKQFIELLKED
ncbi:MAG: LysR family transcriptional regulator [Pedosphaera sp.]|nr:LysR family transcriptional regulator [Pedosphaera sp.]